MALDASAAKAGASVELRFEMDTLVLFHTCPHPLSTAAELSAQTRALRNLRRAALPPPTIPTGCRRRRTCAASRTTASSMPAARGRIDAQGKPARSWRRALPQGGARRRVLDPRRAQGRELPHRRSRRQSGRRHAVLQRRRSRRALFGDRHHPRARQHLSQHRHGPSVGSLPADAHHHRRHRAAVTTRSAAPARPRATPCATRSTRSRCTPAATASCSRSPRTTISA